MIRIGPDHPAWNALDDDDWGGATFSNFLNGLAKKPEGIVLCPDKKHSADLVKRMVACFLNAGCTVTVEPHENRNNNP